MEGKTHLISSNQEVKVWFTVYDLPLNVGSAGRGLAKQGLLLCMAKYAPLPSPQPAVPSHCVMIFFDVGHWCWALMLGTKVTCSGHTRNKGTMPKRPLEATGPAVTPDNVFYSWDPLTVSKQENSKFTIRSTDQFKQLQNVFYSQDELIIASARKKSKFTIKSTDQLKLPENVFHSWDQLTITNTQEFQICNKISGSV